MNWYSNYRISNFTIVNCSDMKILKLLPILLGILLLFANTLIDPKLIYKSDSLILTETTLTDALGSFTVDDLPIMNPKCQIMLRENATPLSKKMWKIALNDIEKNEVTNSYGSYFAAGRRYTDRVYTRDIAFAGILGLNVIFPKEMLQSLKVTREVIALQGYKVSSNHVIKEIGAPWDIISNEEPQVMAKYKTNSITRRTDDVVWIWAVDNLFSVHPEIADWQWFYTNGKENFKTNYDPWFDKTDGLFRAQSAFQDLTSSGYPKGMTISDCVLLKGTSTNCIYYKAMLSLANAARKCNLPNESKYWNQRAESLKKAIRKELILPDGTLTYYKDRYGVVMKNQHNLGTAFAVLFGIVKGKEAKKAIDNYPITDKGVPLIFPFLEDNKGDHNNASWPFCDTYFLQAKELVDGKDYTGYNAALLARTMGTKLSVKRESEWGGFGSFHEKVELPGGLISGSGQQLWTSAAFINVCLRANLVDF